MAVSNICLRFKPILIHATNQSKHVTHILPFQRYPKYKQTKNVNIPYINHAKSHVNIFAVCFDLSTFSRSIFDLMIEYNIMNVKANTNAGPISPNTKYIPIRISKPTTTPANIFIFAPNNLALPSSEYFTILSAFLQKYAAIKNITRYFAISLGWNKIPIFKFTFIPPTEAPRGVNNKRVSINAAKIYPLPFGNLSKRVFILLLNRVS